MDEADAAQNETEALIQTARMKRHPELLPIQSCHYCDQWLHNSQALFCDRDCAAEYEHLQTRKIRGQGMKP